MRQFRHCWLLLALLLAGCVIFVAETTQEYDWRCEIVKKHMVLKGNQVGAYYSCRNESCVALLVAAGVVSASTFVIAGSIAVVGDAVYWLEAQSDCEAKKLQPR